MQHEMKCPACNALNRFSDESFYDGMPRGCEHCGAELILSREWDDFADCYRWQLLLPDEVEDDEM